MKRAVKTLFLLLLIQQTYAQHVYQIRADSVRIYNVCDTAELIIENRTRGVSGFLYNKGKGVTEFRRIRLESIGNGRIAVIGQDTLDLTTLPLLGGIDTIYRSGDSIVYVKKGVRTSINLPGGGSDIQNQVASAQSGPGFWIAGGGRTSSYFEVSRNGSASLQNGFLHVNEARTGGFNLQLNNNVNPGLSTWLYDGSTWKNRFNILSNGNVGVGILNPEGKLHVIGEAYIGQDVSDGAARLKVEPFGYVGSYISSQVWTGSTWLNGQLYLNGNYITLTGHSGVYGDLDINGNLDITGNSKLNGGVYYKVRSVWTSSISIASDDYIVICTTSGPGNAVATLPATTTAGKTFVVMAEAATVILNGSASTLVKSIAPGYSCTVVYAGPTLGWRILSYGPSS